MGIGYNLTESQANETIQRLTQEKEAMLQSMKGICILCKHAKRRNGTPDWISLRTCKYMEEKGIAGRGGGKCKCEHWEWKGLEK